MSFKEEQFLLFKQEDPNYFSIIGVCYFQVNKSYASCNLIKFKAEPALNQSICCSL